MNRKSILLSTTYCGPVVYFSKIARASTIYIEKHEHFIKQTYRNRCEILGANGVLPLIIPLEQSRKPGLKITSIQIAYHTEWQRNHWRTLFSAYNNSPFFEYYAPYLIPFFEKKWKFIFDFNNDILAVLLDLLKIETEIRFTESFEVAESTTLNLRNSISPKISITTAFSEYQPQSYTQVFDEKYSFIPNLSIIDLLFNTGPQAAKLLLAT